MKASDMLRNNNGLKTTQSVLNKQQSGVDAANKVAQTQAPVFTQQQLDAAGKKVDQMNTATPQNETPTMKAAREKTIATQQAIANGVDVNQSAPNDEEDKPSVPIVKKEEPKPQPKQLSYADMYKMLNPELNETAEQRANREKKERTKARISALGDGLRALSNIYFATKGAKVVHNPESDMTKAVNKRKAYMDAQREKNRASWLAGYQRALALDEEARKNNLTLGEQIRHNVENEGIAKTKLDQSQQRIDINRMRITNQQEYNQARLELDRLWKENRISQGEKELAIKLLNAQARQIAANKSGGGRGSRGGSSKEDWDSEYLKLNGEYPSEVANASETVAKGGIKPNTTAGRKQVVKIVRKKIAHKGGGSSHGGGYSSTGGKKKTGVNWIK
jgi:hypothetical protein